MKKRTLLALLGLMVPLIGCGETTDSTTATASPESDVAAAEPIDSKEPTEPAEDSSGTNETPAVELTDGIYLVDDYDPARDASADLQSAIDNAGKTKKRILLEVGGQW